MMVMLVDERHVGRGLVGTGVVVRRTGRCEDGMDCRPDGLKDNSMDGGMNETRRRDGWMGLLLKS